MGILFSSRVKDEFVCPPHESIINLSDEILDRLTCGEKEEEKPKVEEKIKQKSAIEEEEEKDPCRYRLRKIEEQKKECDDRWMLRLKCFDDVHSNTYGITVQNFENLLKQTAEDIGTVRTQLCSPDELLACMKRFPKCLIKCKHAADKYIDCIDTYRINIYKEFIECELKEKRKEDQQVVEEFLNSPN